MLLALVRTVTQRVRLRNVRAANHWGAAMAKLDIRARTNSLRFPSNRRSPVLA